MVKRICGINTKDNKYTFSKCQRVIAIFGIIVVTMTNIYASDYIYTNSSKIKDQSSISTIAPPKFAFQSKSQMIMEASTGTVIYANNESEKLLPASVTKVMTLLLTMEAIDSGKIKYTDMVTCSENASKMGGSQIWFKPGEKLTIDDALKAVAVVSANDVSVALGEMLGGTEGNFVNMMNEKAKELGMINTHFMNCHGIDEEDHYTSAKDIAIMSRELITKHPNVLKYTSIWMDNIREGSFGLSNTNKLIRFYDGAVGLKTGSTDKALFNLSSAAKRDGMMLIAVVMTAPSSDIRNDECKQLLDYGFANYKVNKLIDKNSLVEEIDIDKNIETKLKIVTKNDGTILNEKGSKKEYTDKINIDGNIPLPILKGQKVGILEYLDKEGKQKLQIELIADNEIQKSGIKAYMFKAISLYVMI